MLCNSDPTVATVGESKLVKISQNTLKYEDDRPPQALFAIRVPAAAPEENN
jgi:hypothetical protein